MYSIRTSSILLIFGNLSMIVVRNQIWQRIKNLIYIPKSSYPSILLANIKVRFLNKSALKMTNKFVITLCAPNTMSVLMIKIIVCHYRPITIKLSSCEIVVPVSISCCAAHCPLSPFNVLNYGCAQAAVVTMKRRCRPPAVLICLTDTFIWVTNLEYGQVYFNIILYFRQLLIFLN